MDIPDQLRAACAAVRRKDYPLAELIPTMQLAADVIDKLREQLQDHAAQFRIITAEVRALREEVGRTGPARSVSTSGFIRVVDGKKVADQ